jgi:hypothetical protein
MLKYASKFFFEKIMPSVVATVAGAYIVNHYVVSKPADAPVAAAVSSADPVKAADVKASDGATHVANIPEAGVRAKGISEKAIERTPVEKVIEKPVRPAEAANRSEEPKRHPQAQREKTVAKATTAETVANSDEGRDATDLARAAIERLRGTNESAHPQEPVRSQETAMRQPEPPRVAVQQDTSRPVPASVQPLPPAIMVSTPRTETPNPQVQSETQLRDPRRPIPPADIPEASQPLDLQANAEIPAVRNHSTTVADDVLSAAKSVFQAVLPR